MSKAKLGDLFDIGSSKRVLQSDWREEGIPFYRAREIVMLSQDGYVDNDLFIDEGLYEEYVAKYGKPEPGDLMVTGVGTIGICYIVRPTDTFYYKDASILCFHQRHPELVCPEYVAMAFRTPAIKEQLDKNTGGSTVATLTIQTANRLEIELPSLEEQKLIVSNLAKIECVIGLRKQELIELDDLIKARFVEMFGTYPANEKDWPTGAIRDLVTDVRYGSSRKAAEGDSGRYPYLRMNNITYGGELDLTDVKTIDIPEEELDKCSVRYGDLLFNRTNSKELVGKTCVYNREELMVLAGFVVRVRLNEKALPEFVSAFLNTDFSKKMLLGMCKAAIGQANINAQELQSIGIYIPPLDMQKTFVEFVAQVNKTKSVIQKSLDETQLLFDSLMQQYFG